MPMKTYTFQAALVCNRQLTGNNLRGDLDGQFAKRMGYVATAVWTCLTANSALGLVKQTFSFACAIHSVLEVGVVGLCILLALYRKCARQFKTSCRL